MLSGTVATNDCSVGDAVDEDIKLNLYDQRGFCIMMMVPLYIAALIIDIDESTLKKRIVSDGGYNRFDDPTGYQAGRFLPLSDEEHRFCKAEWCKKHHRCNNW